MSSLQAATIAHVATALGLEANEDGTEAWAGIERLARKTKRHRSTVIAVLGHLERMQLIHALVRAGSTGIPRTWATSYCLMRPPLEVMAAAGLGDSASLRADDLTAAEIAAAWDFFTRVS